MNNSILGLGIDLVEISRIKESIDHLGQKFIQRLFSEKEQEYCNKYKDSLPHYAARFAAKEALVKALGCGFGKDFAFLDCEVINDDSGKPHIHLSDKANKKFNNPSFHLSLSHSQLFATAVVIWEKV
jgi:holo-[acyl-carrier protein] synthase